MRQVDNRRSKSSAMTCIKQRACQGIHPGNSCQRIDPLTQIATISNKRIFIEREAQLMSDYIMRSEDHMLSNIAILIIRHVYTYYDEDYAVEACEKIGRAHV